MHADPVAERCVQDLRLGQSRQRALVQVCHLLPGAVGSLKLHAFDVIGMISVLNSH